MNTLLPHVCLDLKATNKQDAIRELASLLFESGRVSDLEKFIADIKAREAIMSTYCGYHLAIPHSESEVVKEASFAFGRSTGLEWDEGDDLVNFIIILAIPKAKENEENVHVDLMSSIALLALEDEVRAVWKKAETTEQILQTFNI